MSRWLQQSFIYSGYIVKTHFKLLGMINLFSSVNVIFLFILFFPLGHCSLSAGEISPSPLCGLILEDDLGLCGYALALTDAKPAAAKIQVIQSKM